MSAGAFQRWWREAFLGERVGLAFWASGLHCGLVRDPRHIVITGASSGLGAALAQSYAAPGMRLSLHGRDAGRLAAVAERAGRSGARVTTFVGTVTDALGLRAWLERCDREAPVELVIANAGISAGTVGGAPGESQNAAIFATNLQGVLNTVQPLLPLMRGRRRGQIALMSSLASFRGTPGSAAYCASKAAVRLYGEALRGEVAAEGLEVSVICPGFVATPMTDVNRFPMPFKLSAERAAMLIRRGLERNRARIAFPWPMYVLVRCLAALPPSLTDRLLVRWRKTGA